MPGELNTLLERTNAAESRVRFELGCTCKRQEFRIIHPTREHADTYINYERRERVEWWCT